MNSAQNPLLGACADPVRDETRATVHGLELLVPSGLLPVLAARPFEPLTTARMERVLRPGMTVADVGAHVGYYTVLARRRLGSEGTVCSVEPAKDNARLLLANLKACGDARVIVFPCAAGEDEGERQLYIAASSDSHSLYRHPLRPPVRIESVNVRTLDAMLPGPVDLVKIDVEGAEMDVLSGMRRLLANAPPPIMVIEWNPLCLRAAGRDPRDLPRFLEQRGYSLTVLDELAPRTMTVREAVDRLGQGLLPAEWYANLWAER